MTLSVTWVGCSAFDTKTGGECKDQPWNLGIPDDYSGECKTVNDSDDICKYTGEVDGYRTYGKSSSYTPRDGDVPTTINTMRESPSSCTGSTGENDFVIGDGGEGDGATWYSSEDVGSNSIGSLACGGTSCSCDGVYNVKLSTEPDVGNCGSYGNIFLKLKGSVPPMVPPSADGGTYPSESDCVSGSGRFVFLPLSVFNYDGDGFYSAVLLPIRKSGTGKMTNRAWVTDAELISAPSGQTIRMVKGDSSIVVDSDDAFVDASTKSVAVTGSHNFQSGEFTGNPYFFVQEYSPGDVLDFEVDLDWSCATTGTPTTTVQGWQFSLSDIGCTGFNQPLTLRYYTGPNRVEIEQYGNPHHVFVEPTVTVPGNGRAFVFEEFGLTVDATLTSWSSSSATVQIDEISSVLGNHCSIGTYTFYAE